MSELAIHRAVTWAYFALGGVTFAALFFVTAPYGRHTKDGWGPSVGQRLGWVLMEIPAVVLWLAIYASGSHAAEAAPLAMMGLWQLHYVQRTFIYPLRIRAGKKRTPLVVVLSATAFQTLNAWVNARWVSELGSYPASWLTSPAFVIGAALFLLGFALNLHSDTILIRLRADGPGYRIPRGGLFRWISCPNYFAEMLEWTGWAILTWSLAGAAFACYTVANLLPRALEHHRWYQREFADYPKDRRALVPFLL